MKLISCHIENFGKISNYDHDFQEGCNVICERNGWGKSTLMAFLRVMLYGFVNGSKRSELENERKRYKPWQGGVYGGNLTFEADGKIYRCYRVFGDKEKEDQFRLLDAVTNLESNDFSEKLGEELFQIDQDSFLKSACIVQTKSDIRFVGTTGSMNAKLGDLMEETGDISQFEAVDKKLSELLNQMSPKRATGSLYKQKKEMEEYSFEITKKGKLEQVIADIRKKRQEEAGRKSLLEAERDQVNAKQKQLVIQEKGKHYRELLRERDQKREEFESQRKCLPKVLPDEEGLELMIKTADEMEENHSAMEIYALSAEEEQALKAYEERFAKQQNAHQQLSHSVCGQEETDSVMPECRLPEKEEIDRTRLEIQRWRENNKKLKELRLSEEDCRKRAAYRDRFSVVLPEEDELERLIRDWEKRNRKKEALSTKEASLNMARMAAMQAAEAASREAKAARAEAMAKAAAASSAKKSAGIGMKIFLLGALIMVSAGIFLLVADHMVVGIAALFLSFIMAGMAVLFGMRSTNIDTLAARKRSSQHEYNYGGTADEAYQKDAVMPDAEVMGREDRVAASLEREIREDECFVHETEAEIRQYFDSYNIEWEEYRISDELHQLKNAVREYRNLTLREERYRQQETEYQNDELQKRIEAFLGRYDVPENIASGEYGELLQRLAGDVEKYRQLNEKKVRYMQRAGTYGQQKEEIHSYLKQLPLEPAEDLHAQLLELQKRLGICIGKQQALCSAQRTLEEYEEKEDVNALQIEPEGEVLESAEQLYERQNEISGQMEQVQSNIYAYNMQLEENEEKIERINEQEMLLEELKEAYDAALEKYHHLEKTQKYLKIAKERFTEKYMAPLMNGFRKYYGILTGEEAAEFRLDANAQLTVDEQGLPRLPELLSTGYRDITGLCMRMALIDAMYQDKTPFILLDDPFVNYDERNLRGGMDFLKKASEKYQIIYFTCREAKL